MPKYRKLHTKSVESEDINDMPDDFTRLMWVMLPLGLCREGRGKNSPAWIRSKIFPIREDADLLERISGALDWYEQRGMIERYEVDGRRYFHILSWHKHQGNTIKEGLSIYPPPPQLLPTNSRPTPELVPTRSSTDAQVDTQVDAQVDAQVAAQDQRQSTRAPKTDPTPAMKHYESLYGIFRTETDLVDLLRIEEQVGISNTKAALTWAYRHNPRITSMAAICTAALNWQSQHARAPPKGNGGPDPPSEPAILETDLTATPEWMTG